MTDYFFGSNRDDAARLRLVEQLHDPQTIAVLSRLARPQTRAIELGAGAGSIASWMRSTFDPSCEVVAIDRDISLLAHHHDVRVVQLDLARDALPAEIGGADLVHARLLLSHLGEHARDVAQAACAALRPGGWIVLEDIDTSTSGELFGRGSVAASRRELKADAHTETNAQLGRQLFRLLMDLGMCDIGGEGRMVFSAGDLNDVIRQQYELMDPEAEFNAGDFAIEHSTLISAWARRPPEQP